MTYEEKSAPRLWDKDLPACFGSADHDFARHPDDRARAFAYLTKLVDGGARWLDVEKEVEAYLKSVIGDAGLLKKRLARVESLLSPWLPD